MTEPFDSFDEFPDTIITGRANVVSKAAAIAKAVMPEPVAPAETAAEKAAKAAEKSRQRKNKASAKVAEPVEIPDDIPAIEE